MVSSAVHSHTLPRVFQTLVFLKSNNSFVIWVTFEGIARKKCSSHRPVDNDRKPEQMHYYKYYEYFQWVWSSYLHSLNCKTAPKPLPLLKQKLICLEECIPRVCMCVWFNSIFKDLMLDWRSAAQCLCTSPKHSSGQSECWKSVIMDTVIL